MLVGKRYTRILLTVLVLGIAPYLLLSFFTHPAADDFSYAIKAEAHGFWAMQKHMYQDWSGRYLSTLLLSANPVTWRSFEGYRVISFVLIPILWISSGLFLKSVFPTKLSSKEIGFLATALVGISVHRLPLVSESFYWMAGFINYTVPLLLFLPAVGMILNSRGFVLDSSLRARKPFVLSRFLFLALASFVIIGSNETIMLMWDSFLFAIFVLQYRIASVDQSNLNRNFRDITWLKRIDTELLVLGLLSLALTVIVIAAPGNISRAKNFQQPGLLLATIKSLGTAFWYSFRFLGPALICFLLLSRRWILNNSDRFARTIFNRKSVNYTLVILFAISFLAVFPAFMSVGERPPKRVLNMIVLMHNFVIGALFLQLTLLNREKIERWLSKKFLQPQVLVAAFVLSFTFVGNNLKAYADLFTRAAAYDRKMLARYELIKQNPGTHLEVPRITDAPSTIVSMDIEPTPDDWKNSAYARYFGLLSIRTK